MQEPVAIDAHELQRLRAQGAAWEAVWAVLIKGNPDTFRAPGNGTECAVREIKRLQGVRAKTEPVEDLKPVEGPLG